MRSETKNKPQTHREADVGKQERRHLNMKAVVGRVKLQAKGNQGLPVAGRS